MNAVTFITPAVDRLDQAQKARAAELGATVRRPLYAPRSVYHYCSPGMVTAGLYCNANDAKDAYAGVVTRWIELGTGTDLWRSEDGRYLILDDKSHAPAEYRGAERPDHVLTLGGET